MAESGTREVEIEDDTVIEVEVDGDLVVEPAKVTEAKTPEPEPKTPVAPPAKNAADEAADALKAALEKEKQDRIAAQQTAQAERLRANEAAQRAQQSEQRAQEAVEEAASSQLNGVTARLEAATRELEAVEAEVIHAKEAGEIAKEAKAQIKAAKLAAAIDRLEADKVALENKAARQAADATRTTTQVETRLSPFEQYVSGYTPASQAWLRAHPECVPVQVGGDAKKNAAMMKGHYAAIEQGFATDTPDYFRVIEESIGARAPVSAAADVKPAGEEAHQQATKQPVQRQTQQRAVPSAPVTREAPSASTGQSQRQRVQLNPQQQEVALFSYPAKQGEDEAAHRKRAFGTYAAELVKATAEGKIGRVGY